MSRKEFVTLNHGGPMPRFGLGTWLSEKGKVGAAVKEALRIGYRHVDCAHIYGNEAEIGEALTESFAAGHAKREEVFVTSKLWNADHAAGDVRKACELTLKNLQLEYLDLYLIHWPIRCRPNAPPPGQMSYDDKLGYSSEMIMETWREMEKLVDAGLVRAIGVSNFTIPKLKALVEKAKLVPAVNQVESHPYFQQPKLKEFCAEKGIVFEAYSPLGAAGRPPRAQEAGAPVVLEDPVLISIAKKHDRSPAQVALSWALAHGHVVIPKSVTPSRIAENLAATELRLDADDMKAIDLLDRDYRLLIGRYAFNRDQTAAQFWDGEGTGSETS